MVHTDSGLLSFDVAGSLIRAIDPNAAWPEADDEALKFAAMLYPQLVVCAPADAIDSFRKRLAVDGDTDREIEQWLVPVMNLAPELAGGEVDFAPIRDQLREFAQEKRIDSDRLEAALEAPAVNLRGFLGPAYLSLRHELHYHHVERPTALADALSPLSVSPSGPDSMKAAIPELAQISWAGVMELRRDGFTDEFRRYVHGREGDGSSPESIQQELRAVLLEHHHANRPPTRSAGAAGKAALEQVVKRTPGVKWLGRLWSAKRLVGKIRSDHRKATGDDAWTFFVARYEDMLRFHKDEE